MESPAGSGAVPVTVTTPGGTAVFGTFCYLPVPLLTGITTTSNPNGGAGPAMGPYTGGGTAVITGVNLSGTTSVRFGSRPATLQSVTDTAVTVGIPGVPSPGPVPVSIITSGESAGGLTFTYLDVPALTGVSPGNGPTGGGTDVTITGNHLATTQGATFASWQDQQRPPGRRVHLRPIDGLAELAGEAGFAEAGRMLREPREEERHRRGHLLMRQK